MKKFAEYAAAHVTAAASIDTTVEKEMLTINEDEGLDFESAEQRCFCVAMRGILASAMYLNNALWKCESTEAAKVIVKTAIRHAVRTGLLPETARVEHIVYYNYRPATWYEPEEWDTEDMSYDEYCDAEWYERMLDFAVNCPYECIA